MKSIYKSRGGRVRLKGVMGIILIILAIAGIFLWENYGREQLMYTDVIVFKEEVPANKIVKESMLGRMKVDSAALISDVVRSPEDIVGLQTLTTIPSGLQLTPKFFEREDLATGAGKYILPVPEEWIYTLPQTIRRGDTLYFHPMISKESERKGTYNEEGVYIEGPKATGSIGNEAILSATVAYVKDNTNREIIDVTPVRVDGSATVAEIEIVVSKEGYQKLRNAYEAGNQFIVMYE